MRGWGYPLEPGASVQVDEVSDELGSHREESSREKRVPGQVTDKRSRLGGGGGGFITTWLIDLAGFSTRAPSVIQGTQDLTVENRQTGEIFGVDISKKDLVIKIQVFVLSKKVIQNRQKQGWELNWK